MSTTVNTIIVLLILCVVVAFGIRAIIRDHRSGGCSGCPQAGTCTHKGNCSNPPVQKHSKEELHKAFQESGRDLK